MSQLFGGIILVHLVLNFVFIGLSSLAGTTASCDLDVTLFCGTPFGDLYTEIYGESGSFKFWNIFQLDFLKSMTSSVLGLFFFNYEILKDGGVIVSIVRGLLIMVGISALIGFIFVLGPLIVSVLRTLPFLGLMTMTTFSMILRGVI